ncbi:MAG: TetR/AcrR family transcriptional regulator [Polyangiaceae bacterium]
MSSLALSKRECILVEAAKMFARFGFRKTSIDEIAKEAGVGKGTVYLAAESKEELFYQVVHREVRAWQAACAKVVDPRIPADELLLLLYSEAQKHLTANGLVRDLFSGETSKILPNWATRYRELQALGRANVAEVLRIGIRQGLFREELEVDEVAGVLQDLHIASLILTPADASEASLAHRARVAFDLVLQGLRTRPLAETSSAPRRP